MVVKIVDYNDTLKEHIKTLNYEWLQKYFSVEDSDVLQLSNPQEEIIDKGGKIFFALHNEIVVGTSSIMKVNEQEYELAKMAVTENAQGLGIGKLLLEHCIKEAELLKVKKLSLFSNTKLEQAITLYRRYGFEEVQMPNDVHYKRANIKMEKYFP
jgi:N-acetylglutamate synthase-like GNAT family acetyltransferase